MAIIYVDSGHCCVSIDQQGNYLHLFIDRGEGELDTRDYYGWDGKKKYEMYDEEIVDGQPKYSKADKVRRYRVLCYNVTNSKSMPSSGFPVPYLKFPNQGYVIPLYMTMHLQLQRTMDSNEFILTCTETNKAFKNEADCESFDLTTIRSHRCKAMIRLERLRIADKSQVLVPVIYRAASTSNSAITELDFVRDADNYGGWFKTSLRSDYPVDSGRNVPPETDPTSPIYPPEDSSSSEGGDWPPEPPGGDGCYVLMYCDGNWSFEPVRDYECEDDSSSGGDSSSGSDSGSGSGSDSGSSSGSGSDSGSGSGSGSDSGSGSGSGEPEKQCIYVSPGYVFYGKKVFYVPAYKFGPKGGYIYVNWNNDEAALNFTSTMPEPTEYWHVSIIAVVTEKTTPSSKEGEEPAKSYTIVQQQHGAVVQALSRMGIWEMIFKGRKIK